MSNENELTVITELVVKALANDCADYFEVVAEIANRIPSYLVEQLQQLVYGPVWDGDIISKQYRDILIKMGIGVSVCSNGEQGYTGTHVIGYSILKAINEQYDAIVKANKQQAARRPRAGVAIFN